MSDRRGRAGLQPRSEKKRRASAAPLALSICFPVAVWLVAGIPGLVAGIVTVGTWWGLRPPTRLFWALSVALLALAPVTMILQGLPHTAVVGSAFGADHLIAHHVVTGSLALAAFAGLTELFGIQRLGPRSSGARR